MTLKLIFGIALMLVVSVGTIQFSFADYTPPLKQLAQGIAPEDILCRDNRVLVIRTNDQVACVTEKSSDMLGWMKLVKQNIISKEFEKEHQLEKELVKETNMDDSCSNLFINVQTECPHVNLQITTIQKIDGYSNDYVVTFQITTNNQGIRDVTIIIISDIAQESLLIPRITGENTNQISIIHAINPDSISAKVVHFNLN